MNINIAEFRERFACEYNFLYNHDNNVAGYSEAVESFDGFAKSHGKFVTEFEKFRGDLITSDRERASFMFALETMTS